MPVDGRVSVRIVAFMAKFATAVPVFATWTFQVQGVPSVVALLTVSVFNAVRSGAETVTVSLHELLASLLSATTFAGSAAQTPPVGFAKLVPPVGVATKLTSKEPPAASEAEPPVAGHASTLLVIVQVNVPVMPAGFDMLAVP